MNETCCYRTLCRFVDGPPSPSDIDLPPSPPPALPVTIARTSVAHLWNALTGPTEPGSESEAPDEPSSDLHPPSLAGQSEELSESESGSRYSESRLLAAALPPDARGSEEKLFAVTPLEAAPSSAVRSAAAVLVRPRVSPRSAAVPAAAPEGVAACVSRRW